MHIKPTSERTLDQTMSVTFKKGDLLEFREIDAIAHVVNCLCIHPHGLSMQIAEKYPWGDVYQKRQSLSGRNLAKENDRGVPGTIQVFDPPLASFPTIICLLAQWDYGRAKGFKARQVPPYVDSESNRTMWCSQCLEEMGKTDVKTVAIPYRLGCGLGGQDWGVYLSFLRDWAVMYDKNIVIAVK